MKNKLLLLLIPLLMTTAKTYSQSTEVIGGFPGGPLIIAFSGNYLYMVAGDKIQKIDVTLTSPSAVTVVSGLTSPQYLAIKDNYLYIAQGTKISKVNINAATPTTATDVITGIGFAQGLCFSCNTLYIAFYNGGKIAKIDVTQSNPVLTNVITGISSPIALAINGNDLYFSSTVSATYPSQGISKIDVTQAVPVMHTLLTGVDDPKAFILNGNALLFSELGANTIAAIDITQANPVKTLLLNVPLGPYGIAIYNNPLYAGKLFAKKI